MSADGSNGKVGYRRPPRHTRFLKGKSGNPGGRPKGAKNFTTLLSQYLAAETEISENGQTRWVSKAEAAIKQLVDRAAEGDPKQMQRVFTLMQWLEGRTESLPGATDSLTEADRHVIANIYARLKVYD
jgi:hypothetical protein